jgi:hypothetical protein
MSETQDERRKRLSFQRIVTLARNVGVLLGVIVGIASIVIPVRQLAFEQKRANDEAENTNRVLRKGL